MKYELKTLISSKTHEIDCWEQILFHSQVLHNSFDDQVGVFACRLNIGWAADTIQCLTNKFRWLGSIVFELFLSYTLQVLCNAFLRLLNDWSIQVNQRYFMTSLSCNLRKISIIVDFDPKRLLPQIPEQFRYPWDHHQWRWCDWCFVILKTLFGELLVQSNCTY